MNRICLRGGALLRGDGAEPVAGDLLVEGDRIALIGRFTAPPDALLLDCAGLTICPGLIDAHSHYDLQALDPARREKVIQGVTTEIVGNCGFSAFPAPADRRLLHEFANWLFCGGDEWGWNSTDEYLTLATRNSIVNVKSLVGHGSLRIAVAGNQQGPLEAWQLDVMCLILEQCLAEGACGLSTGLMYAPGSSAPFEELERLCRVVARAGKVYATHLRDYADRLPEAVEEQLELARRTGCRLQLSHLQAVGSKNWAKQQVALEIIERARDEGVDVAFDCYPYVAGSTCLTQFLPQWALEGGINRMIERFQSPSEHRRIVHEMTASLAQAWNDLYISSVRTAVNRLLVGQNLAAVAEARGREPAEVVLDLLTEERGAINMLEFNQSEENLRALLAHPLSIVVSDGFYTQGRPHPRLYGAFPFLLGEICRERKWLSLAEAVRKVTDAPARRFGIEQRGRLEPGWFADLMVFDASLINSPATYDKPDTAPVGIRLALRDGRLVAGRFEKEIPE